MPKIRLVECSGALYKRIRKQGRHMKKIKTRDRIKIAAQTLFAERGIDAVGVREIVAAAGQKNMASLHYYFRTKEELARELLVDAADAIESRRTVLLDELEASKGPSNPEEILRIFIECAVIPGEDPRSLSNVRLFRLAFLDDPKFVLDTIGDTTESAYHRCLNHLRTFMAYMDKGTRERRLYLLQEFVFTTLSTREKALSTDCFYTPIWTGTEMLEELVIAAEGILFADKQNVTIKKDKRAG